MQIFANYNFTTPIRSVGVKISNLCSAETIQIDIFENPKDEQLEKTVDNLRNRFGHFCINKGIEYLDKELTNFCPKTENIIHPYSYFR